MSLLNQNSVTNYWWDCPSCGTTKISSILHDETTNEILGSRLCCPECFYVVRGNENSYVDDSIYEVPAEFVEQLQVPRWQCQQCHGLNEKPSDKEMSNLSIDDLYCSHCETWQSDIEGTPGYDPEAKLRREAKEVEAKTRWENPIVPIELIEDRQSYAEKYGSKVEAISKPKLEIANVISSLPSLPRLNTKKIATVFAIAIAVGSIGSFTYDGLKPRQIEGVLTKPQAITTVDIQSYRVIQKEGWLPNTTALDYREIRREPRQNGTRKVEDGIEVYYVTEPVTVGYRTELVPTPKTRQVKTGTRQDCSSRKVGATSVQDCRDVPTYTTQTTMVDVPKQVPIVENQQVRKERIKYRDEPIIQTYYFWQEGSWQTIDTLRATSNNFEIPYPQTSQYQNKPGVRINSPHTSCSVVVDPVNDSLADQKQNIDCRIFERLDGEVVASIGYTRWFGINDVNVEVSE